jgi:V/A-type H+-transporting ATPase subunit I
MIVPMAKMRILGPAGRLPDVLKVIQDVGVLHLTPPAPSARLTAVAPQDGAARHQHQLERILADTEAALEVLGGGGEALPGTPGADPGLARRARHAGRVRHETDEFARRRTALEEEAALLTRYQDLFAALEALLSARALMPGASAYHVVLRRDQAGSLPELRRALRDVLGEGFELLTRSLPSGETALLLMVPRSEAPRVDRLLAETRLQEMPVPHGYGDTIEEAVPRMRARAAAIPGLREALAKEIAACARREGAELQRTRAVVGDELRRAAAVPLSAVTAHAFVIEGWAPVAAEGRLRQALADAFRSEVVLELVSREEWRGEDAPVVLSNPRLFRPFEAITRTLPLPRYGSLDPTPFVAVFFPMFFGLILGDAGYGAAAALLALLLHRRSRPGTTLRMISEMLGACALFAIAFGFAFGEFFGDLGHRLVGMRPLIFNREKGLLPFLGLAVALGVVHVTLGLILGALSERSHSGKAALGRGLSALMVLLILVALLAALEVLPRGFLTPAAIALLVAFPLLVILEGVIAPVEFLSNLGHILSYTRIMALGTASVMLASVANQLGGAMGSVLVGVLFGLLFHLVNFALGLFTPAIHALRLHYVEFFGTFYSPGGARYEPLGHWTPNAGKPA